MTDQFNEQALNVILQKDRDYPADPNEALAMLWGQLFPEWELGDYSPNLEMVAWVEENCGWRMQ